MISLEQWRVVIGSWHARKRFAGVMRGRFPKCNLFNLKLDCYVLCFSLVLIHILLILAHDVETNPGPNYSQSLSICHVDVHSLLRPGRLDDTHDELCALHNFDLIGVGELHLDNNIVDSQVDLHGYSIFRGDCNRTGGGGGGVAVYVNSDIPVKRRLDLETPDIQLIWVELLFKSHKFLLCVCYRPPGQQFFNFIR